MNESVAKAIERLGNINQWVFTDALCEENFSDDAIAALEGVANRLTAACPTEYSIGEARCAIYVLACQDHLDFDQIIERLRIDHLHDLDQPLL